MATRPHNRGLIDLEDRTVYSVRDTAVRESASEDDCVGAIKKPEVRNQ